MKMSNINNQTVDHPHENHSAAAFESALRLQVEVLRGNISNISTTDLAYIQMLALELASVRCFRRAEGIHLGMIGFLNIVGNKRFYLQFAGRRFDRYIEQTAFCATNPTGHLHSIEECLCYRMKTEAELYSSTGVAVTPASALSPIVEPMDLRTNAGQTTPAPSSTRTVADISGFDQRRAVTLPSGEISMELPTFREFAATSEPNLSVVSNPTDLPPCYECLQVKVRLHSTRVFYHQSGHSINALSSRYFYGQDWKWANKAMEPPLRINSGSLKEQREIDLRVKANKKATYLAVAAFAKLNKERRSKQTLKERNAEFREATQIHCDGLGLIDKAKQLWHVASEADAAINKIVETKAWIKETTERMLPHLAGLFTRWLVQPPNFWAVVVDLFVLIERVFPDQCRIKFDQFLIKAVAYKERILAQGLIDANVPVSPDDALARSEARKMNEMRYWKNPFGSDKIHANGGRKTQKEDENLEKSSFLTLLAEMLTGMRLKDRARFTLDAAMRFGKAVSDVNRYRKAASEMVSVVAGFFSRFIKLAVLEKLMGQIVSKEDLVKFVVDVQAIQAYTEQEINSVDFPEQLNQLWKTACEVRALLTSGDQKIEPNAARELNAACNALHQFRTRHFVKLQMHLSAVRNVPYVINLVGESGVHKSDTATLLAKDMCHPGNCNINIGSTDPGSLIYFHSGLKHCDGYVGQPVWFWDDIFQKVSTTSVTAEEDEYLHFIKFVSGAQLALPMAHLDEKGRYFSSPLIISTSNVAYPTSKSIENNEAVQRRRNINCYVTCDKSFEIYPEEAIEYELPNGKKYQEAALQYMQFHIIPSVNKHGKTVTDSTMPAQPLPKHNDPNGMCYTKFLHTCVVGFNDWQNTSSTPRMFAKTPPSRVLGFEPLRVGNTAPDRFNPVAPPIPTPIQPNGLTSFEEPPKPWFHFWNKPNGMKHWRMKNIVEHAQPNTHERERILNFARKISPEERQQLAQEINGKLEGVVPNMPVKESPFQYEDETWDKVSCRTGFLDRILDGQDKLSSIIGTVADYFDMSRSFAIKIMREHPYLFSFGAFVALLSACVAGWNLVMKKNDDLDSLIPAKAREEFVEACHPLIQEEMDNLLLDTTLQLEESKLRANMSAQGYDNSLLKGAAKKVRTKQAHVMRMSDKIGLTVNAGQANNVAVEAKILKNIRHVSLTGGHGLMQAIGVCGHYMLVNQHFFMYARDLGAIQNGKCWITLGKGQREMWSGEIDMQLVNAIGNDVAIFKLPKFCESFPDIRKHFVKSSEHAEGHMINVRLASTTVHTRVVTALATLKCSEKLEYDDKHFPNVKVKVMDWYQVTHTNLTRGDCGAPMILDSVNRIAGIHAASNNVKGIVVPVWREMFDYCSEPYQTEPFPVEIDQEIRCDGQGQISAEGIVPPKWANYIIDKTDIKPSPVHGKVVAVQKQPSVKTRKDPRISEEAAQGEDPIYKSFGQYFEPVHDIPSEFLRKAKIAVLAVLSLIKPTESLERRILSEDEVLNGTRDGNFPGLNIHTSAGMPQRTYAPGKPGKTAFFRRIDENKLEWETTEAAVKFRNDYVHYETSLKAGIIPFVMLQEQLKDETLKESKIKDAKTRTFEVFPGPLALVFRKYFGAFNAAVQKDCAEKPISVGINAHSVAWKILYQRLGRFGGEVIAGDYVAWDKRLAGQAIYESVVLINQWYDQDDSISQEEKEQNAKVRLLLAVILIHSNVVVQRFLFRTMQGLPSGVPITSVLNSVANWLYLYSAIFSILEKKGVEFCLPHELNDHVELALYGDDHIVALSAELREHVTFRDVRDHFLDRRVGYTDANKNAYSDFSFERLEDVTFLKRKFLPKDDLVLGPLDIVSVEDQLNWINENKNMNEFETLAQCFNNFQIEAHLHGKAYFDQKMTALRKALMDCDSPLKECALARLSLSEYKDHLILYRSKYSGV